MTQAGPAGSPAERTALAWGRTSLAVLVNGVLLIMKDVNHAGPMAAIAAALAGTIAVAIYLIGVRRQRTLARRPLPDRITASMEVQLIGVAVLVLIVVTALGLFL